MENDKCPYCGEINKPCSIVNSLARAWVSQKHHVDYFIIPIRNYKDAAKSRENIGGGKPGGLCAKKNNK